MNDDGDAIGSIRNLTFYGVQGDRKIDPHPEYWYASALLEFLRREGLEQDRDDLICLCTEADAAVLRAKLPADHPVRITTPALTDWNGKLKPLTFYIGMRTAS